MSEFPRRDLLRAGGSLLVGFNLRETLFGQSHLDMSPRTGVPGPPDAKQIDTWLAIHEIGRAHV